MSSDFWAFATYLLIRKSLNKKVCNGRLNVTIYYLSNTAQWEKLKHTNFNISLLIEIHLANSSLNFIFWHNLIGSTVNQFRYLNMTKVSEKNTTIFALYSVLYFGRLYKSNGWVLWNEIRWVLNVNNIQQTNLTTQLESWIKFKGERNHPYWFWIELTTTAMDI